MEETKVPVTRTVNNQPLSTNISINASNVPSQAITGAADVETALGNLNNSKVPNLRQVNGKSLLNDITLNDEDIPSSVVSGQTTVEGALTSLGTQLSNQSQQIEDLADEMDDLQAATAYVEDGDTATRTYTEGQFILWKGKLYTVNSGGLPLDTAITGNVTAVTDGGLNALLNASGSGYVKFPDGTLICYGAINFPAQTYNAFGAMYSYDFSVDVSFPQPFISTPIVTASNPQATAYIPIRISYTLTGIHTIGVMRQNSGGSLPGIFNYIAIGRWKN